MNYTLHQLRIFLKVVETESITKAAEALHLTQPAVSIQLKNLQDQIEIPLTEVVHKRLFITDFGREIARAAENILNEVDAITYRTQAFKGELSGRLHISAVSTGKYVIPYFLAEFLQQHPAVELALDVTNKSRVIEDLWNNSVDFSLVSTLPDDLRLHKIELMPNKLFLVGAPHFAELSHSKGKKILEQLPLIFREQGSATRSAMETFIAKHDPQIRKKIELASNEAVKQAVMAGLGCSIVPLIGIRNELNNKQMHIIPYTGLPIKTNWNLVWLAEKKLSPVAEAYSQFLRKHKDRLVLEHFGWCEKYK